MAYGKTCCQEAEHQEWLSTGLVLDIVLDGIWNEVSNLEEDLQQHRWLGLSHVDSYLYHHCQRNSQDSLKRCREARDSS